MIITAGRAFVKLFMEDSGPLATKYAVCPAGSKAGAAQGPLPGPRRPRFFFGLLKPAQWDIAAVSGSYFSTQSATPAGMSSSAAEMESTMLVSAEALSFLNPDTRRSQTSAPVPVIFRVESTKMSVTS